MGDLLAVLVTAVAAYWAGRVRLGHRLFEWAEDRDLGPHGPAWLVAQLIGLVAVAWMLTAHPRRSAANRRSWREARNEQRAPAPGFDPQWINNRKDGPQ